MKITYLVPLITVAALAGCSSPGDVAPSPDAKLTPEQNIEKIKNDPKIPDGLKRIQINTLQHQPGAKP